MSESEPRQINFEARKAFVSQIKTGTIVKLGGISLRDVQPDNPYFPHWLHGTNVATNESGSIPFDDDNLPEIIQPQKEKPRILEDVGIQALGDVLKKISGS